MKKIKYLLMLLVISLLTGCVKYNVNMDIKKDKSMDFSIIYAMNKQLLESSEASGDILEDEDKRELESQGYTIKEYDDGEMKGYTISKKVKNIDEVSTEKDMEYSLSGILEENSDSYLFKVTKGLLKNTYKAKFSFDASDSGLDSSLGNTEDSSDTTDTETNQDTDIDTDIDGDFGDLDFSSLASGMDLSFNVTLPEAALSNNATSTDNGLKKLSWKLDSSGMDAIEFEFELYNMTTIYVGIGVLALFIILIIVIILGIKKGKNKKDNQDINVKENTTSKEDVKIENPTIEQNKVEPQPTNPVTQEVPQTPPMQTEPQKVNPLESINVVPVSQVSEPAEAKTVAPSTLNSFELQIVPPVAPTPEVAPVVPVAQQVPNPEVKVSQPEVQTPTIPESTNTNPNQEEPKKPKIEQLEDL